MNGHHEGSCWLAFNFDWFPDTYYISYLDIFSIMFFLLLSSAMMSMFKLAAGVRIMGSPRLRLLDPKATAVAGSLVLPLAVGSDVAGSLMIRTPLVTGNKLRYTDILYYLY